MKRMWRAALAASALLAGPASAQALKVTVTLDGVHSSTGQVIAGLCGDPKGQFPGGCLTYRAASKASAGQTVVVFDDVKPGTYALQAFHDENGDGQTQIPPEGYAFGNGVSFPASFEAASITVSSDTTARASMTYVAQANVRRQGSQGVAPPAGVNRIDLREGGLYGELYVPATHSGPLPTLILMGGSEGGVDTISGMAVSFAKQGYAALALAYWAELGLPQSLELIPLEYFDRAVAWAKGRPEVDGAAIGVAGWSRGSEAALLLASRNRDVHAVLAVAPSGIVWNGLNFADFANARPAWTANGQPLPSVTPLASAYRPGAPLLGLFKASFADADLRPETEIPVERINGPVLLISGADDKLWPSAEMADRVIARLKRTRFRHGYRHLTYPGAGHVIFVGEPDGPMAAGLRGANPMLGGTPEANAKAWAEDWPEALAFFGKALKGSRR